MRRRGGGYVLGALRRIAAEGAKDRPGRTALAGAVVLGAIAASGQAPWGLWPATLVGLSWLLVVGGRAPSPRAAAWLVGAGGTGHFAAALLWLVEPFLVDPLRHGWMAPFALAGMALGLGLFWAAAGAAGHSLARTQAGRAAALGLTLSAAELARGHVLTGFPWAMPGHVWLDTPLAQGAAVIGASGLTAATLAATGLVAAAVVGTLTAVGRRRFAAAAVAGVLALASGWVWGAARLATAPSADPGPWVRLVQPNVPQHLKWRRDLVWVFFERHLDISATPPPQGAPPPDLVVWPETAVPWLFDPSDPLLREMAAAAGGAPLVVGMQRVDAGRYFNSLVVLEPGGRVAAVYDKHHLVPFGEYIPLLGWLSDAPLPGLAARALLGYSPGPGPVVLDLGPLGRAVPLICYEAVFPAHLRTAERPDFILQITNDAWFGRLSGPWQHLAQARFRAIEQGLPLLRSANTGISAVIDARGRVVAARGLGRAGAVDARLPPPRPPTLFARTGEVPLTALLALALGGLAARGVRHSRRRWGVDARPAGG
ncbi:MAG: apolipoprotein N-acyltransferase [Alkalilacustris sp.]